MFSNFQLKAISNHRDAIYGISIILVILYHCYCNSKNYLLNPFAEGFIGVDIFILLSGYGLCFSYNSRTIKEFYVRRLLRILPVYFTYNILYALVACFCLKSPLSIEDFIYNITTLSYYGLGTYGEGNRCFDWFTAAILLLYLLFPLSYKMTLRRGREIFIILCLFAIFYHRIIPDVPWRIDCLVCRLPIFIFGILLYHYREEKLGFRNRRGIILFLPIFLYIFNMVFPNSNDSSFFTDYNELFFEPNRKKIVYRCLKYLGKNSYELMVANSWEYQLRFLFPKLFPLNAICFVLYHLLAQFCFAKITQKFTYFFVKKKL